MESRMYISDDSNACQKGGKFASTNSIPSLVESCPSIDDAKNKEPVVVLRNNKTRRHSVFDDFKAKRDSLFQRARRSSIFEDKENSISHEKEKKPKEKEKDKDKDKGKEKRRSSEGARRGSVFYVSQDLLEENRDIDLEDQKAIDREMKKGRRKSWHPLAKPPKADRKRRKGTTSGPSEVGSTEGLHTRQKRPSWWNIFVPDSVVR